MIDRNLFLSSDGITFDGKRAVPNEAVTKLMLDLADLKPGEKVLEIGTGSGYQTQHLLDAGCDVYSVDRELCHVEVDFYPPAFVEFETSDGTLGWPYPPDLPFDCIFVACGMSDIPTAYYDQLRDGGRLIIPLGKPDGQQLLRLEKRNGKLVLGRVGGYVRFQMAI